MRFVYHIRSVKTTQMAVVSAICNGIKRDLQLASAGAIISSMQKHGDDVELVEGYNGVDREADGVIVVGIGGGRHPTVGARTIFDAYLGAGKHVIFCDKGYTRSNTFRVVANGFQPKYLMQVQRPKDRLTMFGINLQPFNTAGTHVLFDGASGKYCVWCGLPEPDKPNQQEWGRQVITKIRQHTDLPIIYRPRPSHNQLVAVEGAELSGRPLVEDLARARVVITHGGNLGFDAIVAGKPHFMLHESIAWPVSETDWDKLNKPFIPTDAQRIQWLANVRYCEWTLAELREGRAWPTIRQQLQM